MLLIAEGKRPASARVSVYDRDELKSVLADSGQETIELKKNITVRETLIVRGDKTIIGPGSIKRAIASNSAFGGSLIRVTSGSLKLSSVTIDGRGDASVLEGKLYGWLVEVSGGTLKIGDGVLLTNNKNTTRASDGGGAVKIRSGGTCIMDGGRISGNSCITGGAGVHVDNGGVFYMKSGDISGNLVVGKGAEDGFDGRGGGIYNKGTAGLYGGSVTSNTVRGYRYYGGVGGGIANAGSMVITGTGISSNTGSKGSDIAALGGKLTCDGLLDTGEIWLKSSQALYIGSSFKTGRVIRIVPESVKTGLILVRGLKQKNWKDRFSLSGEVKKHGLTAEVSDGCLKLVKLATPTPRPTPAPTGGSGGYGGGSGVDEGGSSGSYGGAPVRTEHPLYATSTPRPAPTYIPVATLDPEAEIWLATVAPTYVSHSMTPLPTMRFRPYAVPTITPIPTPAPRTPLPTMRFRTYAVPTAAVVTGAAVTETAAAIEVVTGAAVKVAPSGNAWYFSSERLKEIKSRLQTNGLNFDIYSCEEFFKAIQIDMI